MRSDTLFLRCEADSVIGIGHLMRCVALAQAWSVARGRAVFGVTELPGGLESRLTSEGVGLAWLSCKRGTRDDAEATVQAVQQADARWIVVDGDCFQVEFLRTLRDSGLRVLLLDDFAGRESFPADVIVNPNVGESDQSYLGKGATAPLLLGTSYVLLRREFTQLEAQRPKTDTKTRLLVTLGGSDPENLAPRIVDTLRDTHRLQIIVVAGAAYAHIAELKEVTAPTVRVIQNPPAIHELMAESDLAITAAGGTLWELLYTRCAVLSYWRNPVQARVVDLVARREAVRDMGDTLQFDSAALRTAVMELAADSLLRERMADAGHQLIDGRGAERVVAAIRAAS